MAPFVEWIVGIGYNGRSPAFARLLGEREWIGESRNDADYTDVGEFVKTRRRQNHSICICTSRFYAPLTYGWTYRVVWVLQESNATSQVYLLERKN